jgi:hypothetical protein
MIEEVKDIAEIYAWEHILETEFPDAETFATALYRPGFDQGV